MIWAVPCMVRALVLEQSVAKNFPVTRVVEVLKDMQSQLQKEQDTDEEIYEKLACWCETNDKEKSKAIADAEQHLNHLDATIQKNIALSETLKVEIGGLTDEVAKNVKSLDVATALREKQAASFIAEEKEMVQSIQALNAAVVVLGKHHDGSLLSSRTLAEVAATARAALEKHAMLLQGTITPSQKRALLAFAKGGGSLAQVSQPEGPATFKQAYQPQSGEIFGILRQMKETFEADLSESQKEEVASAEVFAEVKTAKQAEIKAGQATLQDKKQQLANSEETLAQAREDKEDTQASLGADEQFLMNLKEKCSGTDADWEARQKSRAEELAAISQAVAILHSDDARDLFSKTFNSAFVQTRSSSSAGRRDAAAAVLLKAAARTRSPALSALATSVRLDAFTRVKKAIDDMVGNLLDEKEEEVKHRDYCVEELNTNEKMTAKEVHTKGNLQTKIEGLEMNINGLNTTINTMLEEIGELKTQKQRASEDRVAQQAEFDGTVADQRETQSLLQQAYDTLKGVYESKTAEPALLQKKAGQTPPAEMATYEKSRGGSSVLALLEHIMADAKAMEAQAIHAEQESRDAYTAFVQDTTNSVQAKQDAVVDRTSEMSRDQGLLTETKSELDGSVAELEALAKGEGDLHASCDYILKNFQARQEARDQEVEALKQAKAYLSGME